MRASVPTLIGPGQEGAPGFNSGGVVDQGGVLDDAVEKNRVDRCVAVEDADVTVVSRMTGSFGELQNVGLPKLGRRRHE